ncbi:MAG: acyltransferase [Pseudomonadota bacterium]|nr:acyltransferase [Pseudomonadota bacterium]
MRESFGMAESLTCWAARAARQAALAAHVVAIAVAMAHLTCAFGISRSIHAIHALATMRTPWIDTAKGIGICLVVYGHVARAIMASGIASGDPVLTSIDAMIYSFHMPLFFFLAGFLFPATLERHGVKGTLARKFDTVAYPYVVWSIVQGSLEVLLSKWTNGHTTVTEVLQLFLAPRAQFWFLFALFMIELVATPLYRLTSRRWYPLLALIAFPGAAGLFDANVLGTPHLWYVQKYFFLFACGSIVKGFEPRLFSSRRWLLAPTLLAFMIAQWMVLRGLPDATHRQEIAQSATALGFAAMSLPFVLVASMNLSDLKLPWLSAIGVASFPIYLAHVLTAAGVRIALTKAFHVHDMRVHLILGCFAGVVLPMLLHRASRRAPLAWLFEPPRLVAMSKWQTA